MTNKELESLLKEISLIMVMYEDGDLMRISEVINKLESIQFGFKHKKNIYELAVQITILFQLTLKGENYSRIEEQVIKGLDIFNLIVKKHTEKKQEISKIKPEELIPAELQDQYHQYLTELSRDIGQTKQKSKKNNTNHLRKEDVHPKENEIQYQITSEPFKIFLAETRERIIKAQDDILKLENDPYNKVITNELFRIFHTIKGECGFLKIASLGEITHNLENLLDLVRSEKLEVTSNIIDILLNGIDYTTQILNALTDGNITIYNEIRIDDFIELVSKEMNRVKKTIGEILQDEGKLCEKDVIKILQEQKQSSYTKKFGEIAVENNLISEEDINNIIKKQHNSETTGVIKSETIDPIIKVKASQVNYLVDMVGELIIALDQQENINDKLTPLKKITREIQYAAMQLRTIKVKNLFLNMKRVVRDVSKKLNKKVILETSGEDLEVDRNLVENLEEPLIHIIRNAVYHGIEKEEDRLQRQKSPEGLITLNAERRGNSIVIAVEDDGNGLNKDKILWKAVEKKLVKAEDITSLSDNEIYNLIFISGFSTADQVDYVSGRGVGMDIVKSVVMSSRGRIEIKSEQGKYTRIMLIFPLSTAIIDGMIVKSGSTYFITPVTHIIESLKIETNMIHSVKNQAQVIDLRHEIIPIIKLSEFFSMIQPAKNNPYKENRLMAVVVENNEKRKYALLVDEIIAKREVVIKSLGNKFKDLPGVSSGTVLQGGKIGFVLDVEEIVSMKNKEFSLQS